MRAKSARGGLNARGLRELRQEILVANDPKRGAPVRIIYAKKGDQYRIFNADLLEVLEIAKWQQSEPHGALD